jgi:hypothetical protein
MGYLEAKDICVIKLNLNKFRDSTKRSMCHLENFEFSLDRLPLSKTLPYLESFKLNLDLLTLTKRSMSYLESFESSLSWIDCLQAK